PSGPICSPASTISQPASPWSGLQRPWPERLGFETHNGFPAYGTYCGWRWSSLGGPCGAGFDALACGVQALGFAGAAGFTPKSQTYKFISFGLSISTSAYSPGCRSALGVIFTQPPGIVSTSAGTKFSF